MKKMVALVLSLMLIMSLFMFPVQAMAGTYTVNLQVLSYLYLDVLELYLAPSSGEGWGENRLTGPLPHAQLCNFSFSADESVGSLWDVRLVTDGDNEYCAYQIDVNQIHAITFTLNIEAESEEDALSIDMQAQPLI